MVAVCREGEWVPAIKISETPAKTPNPGYKHLWRIYDKREKSIADLISLDGEDPRKMERIMLRHPTDHTKFRWIDQNEVSKIEPLLIDVLVDGEVRYDLPSLEEIRMQRTRDIEKLDSGVRRIMNPHIYHVSLTQALWDTKQALIEEAELG